MSAENPATTILHQKQFVLSAPGSNPGETWLVLKLSVRVCRPRMQEAQAGSDGNGKFVANGKEYEGQARLEEYVQLMKL